MILIFQRSAQSLFPNHDLFMKNLHLTFCSVFLLAQCAWAQSTYTIAPNPAVVFALPSDQGITARAYVKNTSNLVDSIRWTRHVISLTNGMQTAICDCIQDYFTFINTQQFTINPGDSCILEVHFYNFAGVVTGPGIVHLKLENLSVPTDTSTAVYLYNPISDTDEPLPVAHVNLFPNPIASTFALSHAEKVAALRVFALDGSQVAYLEASSDHRYILPDVPDGTYVVAFLEKNGRVFQAIEVTKHR